jgi:cobalt-zinc-cadmium resistance protein CzcA
MIERCISFALRHRWMTLMLTVLVAALGLWCYTLLQIEAYPDISDTNVIVITQYEGRAAEEVEQQVTIPIERALNNVPGVIDRRSRTIFGLSVVQLSFQDGTEDFYARQYVAEKLKYAEVPEGIEPELGPLTSPTGEIFRYFLEGDATFTPMDIRTFNDWTVRPALLQIPGIADISTFGGPLKQFQVLTNPEKLRKYNLTLKQIVEAIQENNQNTGGNIIFRGGQGFAVRGLGAVKSLRDLERIVVAAVEGVPIYLKDVASIEIAPPTPSGIMGYTIPDSAVNVRSGTEGIVLLKRGENANTVLKQLDSKIAELRQTLPPGLKIHVLYSRSSLINYTLETVSTTLLEGITIVVIILMLFLGSLRSAFVVAVTIPLSLLFAFIAMKLTGIPANLLSLGAIDFGIIVDGSCVMVEHLVRGIGSARRHERERGIWWFTDHSAREIGREIFFSVTIIILAYLPLFTLERVEGKLFSPMAYTLSFAILGSMFCAMTFVPVLVALIYRKRFEDLDSRFRARRKRLIQHFIHRITRQMFCAYRGLLYRLLLLRWAGVAGLAVVIVVCIALGGMLGTEFLPPLDEGSIFLRCNQPSGISIYESAKIAPKIREIIATHPQVKSVFTQTGRNDDGTDPFGANRTEILIDLKPYRLWARDTSKMQLLLTIKSQLEQAFPGAYFSYGQPIIDQVTEIVNGSPADLAITIAGDSLEQTRRYAERIRDLVKTIPGASEVGIEQEGPQSQIVVDIDRENVARYGINISDVQTMIESAIGGKTIGTVYEGAKRFDIVVRFLPESRNTLEDIATLLVPSVSGVQIPMRELASIRMIDGQTTIYRVEGKRILTVRSNIRGRDQGGFAAEVEQRIRALNIPDTYPISLGGQFENLERASNRLALVIPLTVLVIGVILFTLYKTLPDTLVTLACLPFGIMGGIAALLVRGYYFNVSAGVGFVSLFGVTVMAGVLLVSACNRALNAAHTLNNRRCLVTIASVATKQARPIVMMISVAMIGLLPAALSNGIGSDIQRPLATVIIGGLLSCLVCVPILLPSIYALTTRLRAQ